MADSVDYLSHVLANLIAGSNRDAIGLSRQNPEYFTRYIGGHVRINQPYISGYHHVVFELPGNLFETTNASTANHWLTATCEGFTPHSTTVNFVDVNGIGQLASSFPASRTINREFTLTFREYQKLPIMKIFRTWLALWDPHVGITTKTGGYFVPDQYKGMIMVGICTPTANAVSPRNLAVTDLEEVFMYEGVYPTLVPEDTIGAADQATNESVQASITFKFDGAPFDLSHPGLGDAFIEKLNGLGGGTGYDSVYSNLVKYAAASAPVVL